jgi:hypothetical protein
MNRDFRRIAGLPCKYMPNILVGTCTNMCNCCKRMEKKKHDCSHEYCDPNCPKKLESLAAAAAATTNFQQPRGSGLHLIRDGKTIKKSVFAINK